jgi:hypothetical protein
LQEYVNSILELLRNLKDREQQRAVLNADDEHFAAAAAAASGVPCVTYGINNASADVRAESIEFTLWQTTVSLTAVTHHSYVRNDHGLVHITQQSRQGVESRGSDQFLPAIQVNMCYPPPATICVLHTYRILATTR